MIKLYKIIFKFFDKLEDKIRGGLTHYPIIYAFLGSVGIVSIWRGIWHIEDSWKMSGGESLILGVLLTMLIGLFVSFFIGENIIISGLNKEKRIDEKTEDENRQEKNIIKEIKNDLEEIKKSLKDINKS